MKTCNHDILARQNRIVSTRGLAQRHTECFCKHAAIRFPRVLLVSPSTLMPRRSCFKIIQIYMIPAFRPNSETSYRVAGATSPHGALADLHLRRALRDQRKLKRKGKSNDPLLNIAPPQSVVKNKGIGRRIRKYH